MLAVVPFFACVTWILTNPTSVGADCTVSIRHPRGDLKDPQPLILRRNDSYKSFLYPENDDGILRIRTGDTIYLACPGKTNYLNNQFWGREAEATCIQGQLFNVREDAYDFSALICARESSDSTRNLPEHDDCKHSFVEIGFKVDSTFLPIIEVCRDEWTYMTYYAKSRITRNIGSSQKNYPRPRFKQGPFYKGINVDNLYLFENQKKMFAETLGSVEISEEILQKSVQFLARGHLVAKADFIYGSQQKSTFWFLNVAPQWQTFNAGNWQFLEVSVRKLAGQRQLELDVYTGVYGQMTMEDIYGVEQPIYLDPENQVLPVPKYFWKIVYDPLRKEGVALVGLNDPFVKSIKKSLKICKDITKQITWLNWSPNNITAGISYACTVDALRKKVPTVPNLLVTSVLK